MLSRPHTEPLACLSESWMCIHVSCPSFTTFQVSWMEHWWSLQVIHRCLPLDLPMSPLDSCCRADRLRPDASCVVEMRPKLPSITCVCASRLSRLHPPVFQWMLGSSDRVAVRQFALSTHHRGRYPDRHSFLDYECSQLARCLNPQIEALKFLDEHE